VKNNQYGLIAPKGTLKSILLEAKTQLVLSQSFISFPTLLLNTNIFITFISYCSNFNKIKCLSCHIIWYELVPIFEYMVAWVEIKSNKYLSDIPI
jgi:hypothetical protein